jgi:polysaccharide chain length determinant protein (PEP-CTERM system associated)
LIASPITPNDYLNIAKRRKWSFIFPFFIIAMAGVAVALLLPSVYKSSATILIESQEIPQEYVMTTVTTFVEQRLQSINQRIMSSTRLREIIKDYDLYHDLQEKWTMEEVIEKMREDVKMEPISTEVVDQRTGRPTTATIAFTLSFEGKETPSTIQKVADKLTSLFLEENLKIRERQTQGISQFLKEEVANQKASLESLDAKIAAFKEKHINELPEMLQVNVQGLNNVDRNIERFEDQLLNLKNREGYLETQLASTDPEMLNDQDKLRLKELNLQMAALKPRVSEHHPDMKKLRAEIAELEKQVNMNSNKPQSKQELPDNPAYITLSAQLSANRSDIAFIKEQIKNLEQEKKDYQKRIDATSRIEQEYNTLRIQLNTEQAKFDDLTRKIMEAKIAHNLEKEQKGERFIIIDPPLLPEKPFKPNRLAIGLISVVLGIGAGIGFASLRELSDFSVRTADALAMATSFPVLATIREIVTVKDQRQKRTRRIIQVTATAAILIGAVVIFHFFVMDLDIFWAKLMRRMGRIAV